MLGQKAGLGGSAVPYPEVVLSSVFWGGGFGQVLGLGMLGWGRGVPRASWSSLEGATREHPSGLGIYPCGDLRPCRSRGGHGQGPRRHRALGDALNVECCLISPGEGPWKGRESVKKQELSEALPSRGEERISGFCD